MTLPSAHPVSAIEPAVSPATKPTLPSAVIQANEIHDNARTRRLARTHASSFAVATFVIADLCRLHALLDM